MDLYSEIILDHFKHPQNKGTLKKADKEAEEINTSCGDEIKVFIKLNKEDYIEKIMFEGQGCAISQATASMLTEKLLGKSKTQVLSLDIDYIKSILKVPIGMGRIKCATLALSAIKRALS
ncbi:SUF system NifU family Fe-S cluster assembly protein [Candidatus Peregrinibacteria bacterium]|nr:SUF system NifU family Fe-S cluster assembly protein [Candidatus Peregrinibacteria bacterium]